MKIIKFDLPINGIKVKNLEELRGNLTDEIVTLAHSGQLTRWFLARQLNKEAEQLNGAVQNNPNDEQLFLEICNILEVEVYPEDVSALFHSPPAAGTALSEIQYRPKFEALNILIQSTIKEAIEKEREKIFDIFRPLKGKNKSINNMHSLLRAMLPHIMGIVLLLKVKNSLNNNNEDKYVILSGWSGSYSYLISANQHVQFDDLLARENNRSILSPCNGVIIDVIEPKDEKNSIFFIIISTSMTNPVYDKVNRWSTETDVPERLVI